MPNVVAELQLFQAIADAGTLSAAAGVLGSSPPAISRRLAELEQADSRKYPPIRGGSRCRVQGIDGLSCYVLCK
jgi:hypothetical protein